MEQRVTKTGTPAVVNGRLAVELRLKERTDEGYSLSIYNEEPASMEDLRQVASVLTVTYPEFSQAKMAILLQCLYDEFFTLERAKDALKFVVKNFKYKEPAVADVVSYDKSLRLYAHSECLRLINEGACRFEDMRVYCRLKSGEVLRYKIADAVKLGLIKE